MSSHNNKVPRFDPPSLRMSPVDAMERLIEDNKHLRQEVLRLEQVQQRMNHELNLRQSDYTPGVGDNVPGGPLPGYGYRGSYAGSPSPYGVPSIPIPRLNSQRLNPLPYRKSLSPSHSRAASPVSRGRTPGLSRQNSSSWRGKRMSMMEKSTGRTSRSPSPSVYYGEKKKSKYDVDLTHVLDRRWPSLKDIGDPMTPSRPLGRVRAASPAYNRQVVHSSQQLTSNYNSRQRLIDQGSLTSQLRQERAHMPTTRSEPTSHYLPGMGHDVPATSSSSRAPVDMGYNVSAQAYNDAIQFAYEKADLMRADSRPGFDRADSKNSVVSFAEDKTPTPQLMVTPPSEIESGGSGFNRPTTNHSGRPPQKPGSPRVAKVLHTLDFVGQQRAADVLARSGIAPSSKKENRYDALLARLNNLENKFTGPKPKRSAGASGSKTPTPPEQYLAHSRSRTPTPPNEQVDNQPALRPSNTQTNMQSQVTIDMDDSGASAEGMAMASSWQKLSQQSKAVHQLTSALQQQRNLRPQQAMMDQSATNTNHVLPRVSNSNIGRVSNSNIGITNPASGGSVLVNGNPSIVHDQSVTRTNHVGGLDQSATATNHQGNVSRTSTVVPRNSNFGNLETTNTNHQGGADSTRGNLVTAGGVSNAGVISEATTVANVNPRNAGIHPAQGVVGGGFSTFGTGSNTNAFSSAANIALGNHQPNVANLSEQGAQAFLRARENEQPSSLQETLQAAQQNNLQRQEDQRYGFGRMNNQQPSIMEESAVLMQSASTNMDGAERSGGHTAFFGSSSSGLPPSGAAPVLQSSGNQNLSNSNGHRLRSVQEGTIADNNSSISSNLGNDILSRLNKISALGHSSAAPILDVNNVHRAGPSGAFVPGASASFTVNTPQAFAAVPPPRNADPHLQVPTANSSTGENQHSGDQHSGATVNQSGSSNAAGNARIGREPSAGRTGLENQALDEWAKVMGDGAQLF